MASGVFWDGCLVFPNPIELALWESAHIWPDTALDIAISLGTGIEPRKGSGEQRQGGNSIRRLWHSFMDFLDGESRYQDIENSNSLGKYARSSFFRFNTQLHSAIRLDDIANLDQIRQGVHQCPRSRKDLVEVASALLISNLYFELDFLPVFKSGIYYYHGSIRCRTDCRAIINALLELHLSEIEYVTATEALAECEFHDDICQVCHRYRKNVTVHVRHPTDLVTMSVRIGKEATRRISGFPQSMAWFEAQQSFHSSFGTSDHDVPGRVQCFACCQITLHGPWKRNITFIDRRPRKRLRRE